MKKSAYLYSFLLLSLIGYACQVGRFYTASQQFATSHTYNKSLTKRVLARTINSFKSEKKRFVIKESPRSAYLNGILSSAKLTSITGALNFLPHSNSTYFSLLFLNSGKRGPPSLSLLS